MMRASCAKREPVASSLGALHPAVTIAILAALFLLPSTWAQISPKPLSKDDVVRLLKGDVSPKRVEGLIREHGINFLDTAEAEKDLQLAGADDALLAVVREMAPDLLQKAESYYKAGEYEQALPLFQKAAESGDDGVAAYLGLMYEKGLGGLPKDDAQAVSWYRKAADAGDPRGMSGLGLM